MTNYSPSRIEKIYFIWNEDFSLAAAFRAIGEIVRGEHSCSLCDIAYNRIMVKPGWREYRHSLKIPSKILYRNQLMPAQHEAARGMFPVVLAHLDGQVVVLLENREIDSCNGSLEVFKSKLNERLESYNDARQWIL